MNETVLLLSLTFFSDARKYYFTSEDIFFSVLGLEISVGKIVGSVWAT
jgi:hypothetical protein